MKKSIFFSITVLFFIFTSISFAERYEPIFGKSGSTLSQGTARFNFSFGYNENNSSTHSLFNFSIDYGITEKVEIQNNIGYGSYNSGDFEWSNWIELLKFKLSETFNGPATSLGAGLYIPVSGSESLGLILGFFYSGGIKDITFDFNLGITPFLTYGDINDRYQVRPSPYINGDLVLGYKLLPILKLTGGIDMKQYLNGGATKTKNPITGEWTKTDIPASSGWVLFLGSRVKPQGYPVVLDTSLSFGLNRDAEYDWQFKIGVQILPSGENAEW